MTDITKKQKQVFDFINSYRAENGISPTIEEIRKKLKLKAVSTIHEHVKNLIKNGYLSKSENYTRNMMPRRKIITIKDLIKRQDEILNIFSDDQQILINEAINIEYKLTLVEQGYDINNIN